MWDPQPGHEYTKQNVKFLVTVLQNDAVRNLQKFAENNEQTQGKFTIGDEKVREGACNCDSLGYGNWH